MSRHPTGIRRSLLLRDVSKPARALLPRKVEQDRALLCVRRVHTAGTRAGAAAVDSRGPRRAGRGPRRSSRVPSDRDTAPVASRRQDQTRRRLLWRLAIGLLAHLAALSRACGIHSHRMKPRTLGENVQCSSSLERSASAACCSWRKQILRAIRFGLTHPFEAHALATGWTPHGGTTVPCAVRAASRLAACRIWRYWAWRRRRHHPMDPIAALCVTRRPRRQRPPRRSRPY